MEKICEIPVYVFLNCFLCFWSNFKSPVSIFWAVKVGLSYFKNSWTLCACFERTIGGAHIKSVRRSSCVLSVRSAISVSCWGTLTILRASFLSLSSYYNLAKWDLMKHTAGVHSQKFTAMIKNIILRMELILWTLLCFFGLSTNSNSVHYTVDKKIKKYLMV